MLRIGKRLFSWNSTKFEMAGQSSVKITQISFGEKITRELVRGNRRDGTPLGDTAGDWEPDNIKLKMLADEWYGTDAVFAGFLGLLTLNKSVGLADTEFDLKLQFFEEVIRTAPTSKSGTITIYAPVCRILVPNINAQKGVAGQEVELEIGVTEPIQSNGAQLASLIRSFTTGTSEAGF